MNYSIQIKIEITTDPIFVENLKTALLDENYEKLDYVI